MHGNVPDGNTAMDASCVNRVIQWDPTSGRAGLEARGHGASRSWTGKSTPVVTPVAKRPKVGRTSVAGRCDTAERRGYHSSQVAHDAREQLVSVSSRLVIRCRLSGRRDEESHDERPRGTQTCLALLAGCDRLERSCSRTWSLGGVLRCRPRWRLGNRAP